MDYGLVDDYLQAMNYVPTTREAKRYWLRSWAALIGKPLEDATTKDVLTLKEAFAKKKGRVPLKYYQALKAYYRWVGLRRPGFPDPLAGVMFEQGVDAASKDALSREQMGIVLSTALNGNRALGIVGAKAPAFYGGKDCIQEGKARFRQKEYLWYWVLTLGPIYLFRAHELLPYDAPHAVRIVDPDKYEVECIEGGCGFRARYFQGDDWHREVLSEGKGHVENEKLADFKWVKLKDEKGQTQEGAVWKRKGRVRKDRMTGERHGEAHWSEPKPFPKSFMHHLRLVLLAPPFTAKHSTWVLNRWGELLKFDLRNSNGEKIRLSAHIFSKHSAVTNRILDILEGKKDSEVAIAEDADVSLSSLAPYRHQAAKPGNVGRQVREAAGFWKES